MMFFQLQKAKQTQMQVSEPLVQEHNRIKIKIALVRMGRFKSQSSQILTEFILA
jgi:hypothetical protein